MNPVSTPQGRDGGHDAEDGDRLQELARTRRTEQPAEHQEEPELRDGLSDPADQVDRTASGRGSRAPPRAPDPDRSRP